VSIQSASISVIVQGPVTGLSSQPYLEQFTKRSLESVRKFLPDAELILSTWEGAEVGGLPYDVLLLNKDPGATRFSEKSTACNNINRQIVSTKYGLALATRPFVLKMRSDTILCGTNFLKYFGRFSARSSRSVLTQKVIASTRFSYIPNYRMPLSCYFPSDWFHFGLKGDVHDIWEIPLAPEPLTTQWISDPPLPCHRDGPRLRYANEQYIWISFLRKHSSFKFDSMWDQCLDAINDSATSIASNLVLISPEQAQIRSLKYADVWNFFKHCQAGCYTHSLWRELYEKHCENKKLSCFSISKFTYDAIFQSLESSRQIRRRIQRLIGY
jgi:hypothetical protein